MATYSLSRSCFALWPHFWIKVCCLCFVLMSTTFSHPWLSKCCTCPTTTSDCFYQSFLSKFNSEVALRLGQDVSAETKTVEIRPSFDSQSNFQACFSEKSWVHS